MPTLAHLKFNDLAPDIDLYDDHGKPVKLSSLWREQVLILAFTRHFGCPQCKDMVDQLGGAASDLKNKNLALAIVTQGTPEETRAFCQQHALGILCLADPKRRAYQAYGLDRASIWQTFLSLSVWRSNRHLKRDRGWNTEMPPTGQDAMQMAGTFIIATDGRIRLPYYYDDIADHPSVDLLLHGVMGMDWRQSFNGPVAPK